MVTGSPEPRHRKETASGLLVADPGPALSIELTMPGTFPAQTGRPWSAGLPTRGALEASAGLWPTIPRTSAVPQGTEVIVFLDDYQLPGVTRAVWFFTSNLGWSVEEISTAEEPHHFVVLRTSRELDTRPFHYFVEF